MENRENVQRESIYCIHKHACGNIHDYIEIIVTVSNHAYAEMDR